MNTPVLPVNVHQAQTGARLRKLILLFGMPYTEAAALMGVTKHVLYNWMKGKAYPAPYALYRLYHARQVTYDYVFLGNWSGMPDHLARALEADFIAEADAKTEPAPSAPQGAREANDDDVPHGGKAHSIGRR